MMQFGCWNRLTFFQLWMVQTFLPLIFFVQFGLKLLLDCVLLQATRHGLTVWLLRRGWTPRRSFTFESILDTYLPHYILYLNIYYITGIQQAIVPLLCDGEGEVKYLVASPDLTCWEGTHLTMLAFDSAPLNAPAAHPHAPKPSTKLSGGQLNRCCSSAVYRRTRGPRVCRHRWPSHLLPLPRAPRTHLFSPARLRAQSLRG